MTAPAPIPARGALELAALATFILVVVMAADWNGMLIQDVSLSHPGIDKAAHFVLQLGLTSTLYLILRRHWKDWNARTVLVIAIATSAVFGLLDEGHQYFLRDREFDLLDLAANACGTGAAALLIALLQRPSVTRAIAVVLPLALFAVVLSQGHAQARHFSTAILLIRDGDYVAAHQALLQSKAEGNDSPALYNELAWLELEFLDVDPRPALSYTARALAREKDNSDFLDTHGWALYRNGRYPEALETLLKAYAGNPAMYCIHYHLGVVYHALGKDAEAIRHLKQQAAASPDGRFTKKAKLLLERWASERRHIS